VWIPALDVEAFIQEVLELKDCQVGYSAEAGAWSVKYGEWEARQNVKVTQEFGTSRMNAIELVQCALNVQVPTVRDRDPLTDKYFVNPDETLAAREKLGLIKERFAGWAFEDTERREKLCRIYNDLFNATRPRRFDGSHLKLPGFSRCFVLHPHQLDSVWRIVQSGNVGCSMWSVPARRRCASSPAWSCAGWVSSASPAMWSPTTCWPSTRRNSSDSIRTRRC
jgi:N12 class adenine-specific DNA methylase